jgi:arginyl-tRNA synthetase
MFEKEILKAILSAVKIKADEEEALNWLEVPPQPEMGDLSFPCFRLKKHIKKDPKAIAEELKKKIKLPKGVKEAKVAGPYLNFYFDKGTQAKTVLSDILKQDKKYGFSQAFKGKKVLVEFSAPNTNKPLHVGHVRNNSLGDAISNVYSSQGFQVTRMNLINDRGAHICKSMLAYINWGKNATPETAKKKGDHFVGDYYRLFAQKLSKKPALEQEAIALLKKWEAEDKNVRAVWRKMNGWVLDGFNETYEDFGVHFNETILESTIYRQGKEMILKAKKDGIFTEKEGATVAELERFGLPDKVVLRADGTSLYTTQDINLAKIKFEKYGVDESIHVVGSEQNLYFRQLFKILEIMGFSWAENNHHLSYGMVYLPEGKLKSREGKVVDADNLLAQVETLAEKELKKRYKLKPTELNERSRKIALAAIKFFMLKVDAVKDIHFHPEESVSFEGETGPYVQYAFARAKSILKKAGKKEGKLDFKAFKEAKELELLSLLAKYPEVLSDCHRGLSLHKLARYLIDLSAAFNSFYHDLPVLKAEGSSKTARLALVKATAIVLRNGLKVMGISALDEM